MRPHNFIIMIIGLTGLMGSGKTEVVNILETKGYKHITLSKMVRAEAEKQGVEQTRENLQNLGNAMRKEQGTGVLAKKAIEMMQASDHKNWVVDGIRNPAEIEELRKLSDTVIIGLHAERPTLISRIIRRGRDSDPKTEPEIIHVIEKERGLNQPPDGQQVEKCIHMVDHLIINESTLDELASKVLGGIAV
jgi:dephospho-CoA kinase